MPAPLPTAAQFEFAEPVQQLLEPAEAAGRDADSGRSARLQRASESIQNTEPPVPESGRLDPGEEVSAQPSSFAYLRRWGVQGVLGWTQATTYFLSHPVRLCAQSPITSAKHQTAWHAIE